MSAKKVIIIEDDKMLSTVFRMFLEEIGYELLGFYINPQEAFKKIEEEKPDVVLMDIFLPGDMDGIKASNYIQEFYNIPVIYLSSSTDEDVIKRALESHIYGYLIKPIDKISLRINIELACAKFEYFQKVQYISNVSKAQYSAISTIDENGNIKWFNDSFKLLFNNDKYTEFNKIFVSLGIDFYKEIVDSINSKGFYESIINFKTPKSQKIETFLIIGSKLLNNEIIVSIDKIHIEGNETKNSSEVLSNYETLFNSTSDAVFFINKENILYDFNSMAESYCKELFNVNNPKGKNIFDIFHFFNTSELKNLVSNVNDGISHYLERKIELKEQTLYIKINFFPVFEKNKINKYCILFNNVTEFKTIEQNYIDLKSELKPIFESSIQRFYLVEPNFEIISFNKAAKDVIQKEFKRQIQKGDNILDYVPNEIGVEGFKENFKKALMGENLVFKEKLKQEDGSYLWNESHLDPIINEKGEIYRVLLWTLDITQSETNLIELEKSQERNELVAKGGNDGIWDWDIIENTIYLSPRWKAVLGYEDYELENKFGIRDSLIHPDDLDESNRIMQQYLNGETEVYENEIRLKHKNGEYRWILERGIALQDENKKPYRMAGSITDITEQKLMLNKLSDLNKSLLAERMLFDKGNIAVIKADYNDLSIKYVSSNINHVLGYSEKDFISGNVDIDSLVFEEDRELHKTERDNAFKDGKDFISYTDYRIRKKEGEVVWIRDFTILIKEENNITQLLGYYMDVTEYKVLEQKTKENEEKFTRIFNYANDAIFIVDDNRIIDVNKSANKLFGYSKEEFLSINIDNISPETQPSGTVTLEKRKRKLHEAREGNNEPFYWKFKKKNGELFDAEVSTTYISINGKHFYHSLIRDITYRKEIEKSLQQNKQKNESIIASIPDMVMIFDKKGICNFYKPDFEKKFDFDSNIIIGKGIEFIFTDIKRKTIVEYISKSLEKNAVLTYKFDTSTPIGTKSFEARISPLSKDEVIVVTRNLS